jgi:hypothetical protein
MFASGLFMYKVCEVVLLKFDSPFCVEVFCLLKESNENLPFVPLFYSFQNLVVHRVALHLATIPWILNPNFLVHYCSYLEKYWLKLFDSTKTNHGLIVVVV